MFEIFKKKSDVLQDKLQHVQNEYLVLLQSCLTGSIYKDTSQAPFNTKAFDPYARKHGLDWPAHAQTMIGEKRIANLRELTEAVLADNVPGDFIETGVWRGGACILMRAILYANNITNRTIWVADSFEGLPSPNEQEYPADVGSDFHTYEQLAVSLDEVKENFRTYGLLDDQTKFLKGWFKDTLPTAAIDQLALMRLDGDMYESTMDALNSMYPKLSERGYVIIDDYHVVPACKAAVHDYCSKNGIKPEILEIDGVGVYWRKTAVAEQNEIFVRSTQIVECPELEIERLNKAIDQLVKYLITQFNQSLTVRDAELVRLNAELASLYSSLCWRITKPIRYIEKFIKTKVLIGRGKQA